MKAIAYSELLAMVCDAMGWDPATLSAADFNAAKRAISSAIDQCYKYAFWPELTRTEKRKFHPDYSATEAVTAGEIRYFPPTDAYYTALRDTTGHAPATKLGGDWETNEAYWSLALRILTADDYEAANAYSVGDVVYDPDQDGFYQCHTAAAAGEDPSDTTRWGEIAPLDPVIPWTRAGFNPIGRVDGVYREDPRIHRGAENVPWDETADGIQVREPDLNSPWLRYQLRVPRFTGTNWNADVAYTATTEEDSVTTDVLDSVRGTFAIQGRAALRALTNHEANELQTLDFLITEGDGQGGPFVFKATVTETDDGVDYLKPDDISASNPGRWVRSVNP